MCIVLPFLDQSEFIHRYRRKWCFKLKFSHGQTTVPDPNFETTVQTLKCHQNSISCKILCIPNLMSFLLNTRSGKLGKVHYVTLNLILIAFSDGQFKVRAGNSNKCVPFAGIF